MIDDIVLPGLGEDIKGAVVASWFYTEGDRVEKDEDILEVVTDKAVFNISVHKTGIIKKILKGKETEAKIGEVLALIEVDEEKS